MIGLLQLGTCSGRVAFACCIHFRLARLSFDSHRVELGWLSYLLTLTSLDPWESMKITFISLKIRWRSGRATLITIHSLQFQIFRSEMGAFTLPVICFSFSFFIHHRAEQSVEGKFKCRARKKVHSNHISITKLSQFQAKIFITFWSHNYNFEMEMWDFYYIFF